jgi:dephospho-CoA kinase
MFRIGITGGIGSGKSLVCSILEKLGTPVYYADREARRLMNTDADLVEAIKELLGDDAYQEGELNRPEVGKRVFGNADLLKQLNQLVHPVVGNDFQTWCAIRENVPYVVEEAAILFESGAISHLDMSVLIYAPTELRIRRVMERDRISRQDVEQRMRSQMDEEEKKRLADRVILNDEKSLLLPRIVELHEGILIRI